MTSGARYHRVTTYPVISLSACLARPKSRIYGQNREGGAEGPQGVAGSACDPGELGTPGPPPGPPGPEVMATDSPSVPMSSSPWPQRHDLALQHLQEPASQQASCPCSPTPCPPQELASLFGEDPWPYPGSDIGDWGHFPSFTSMRYGVCPMPSRIQCHCGLDGWV